LIGIHSNIGNSLMENRHIPIDTYQTQWKDMLEGARIGDSNGPMMGVWLEDDVKDGVQIEVMPNSPAEEAGLKTDDIILSVKGKPTPNGDELLVEIAKCRAGQAAEVEVLRGDERLTFQVTPTRRRQLMRRGNWGRRQRGQGATQPQQEDAPAEDDSAATDDKESSAEESPKEPDSTAKNAEEASAEEAAREDDSDTKKAEKLEAERIRELEKEFARRIKEARENGGDVEVPPELKEKYPNIEDLGQRMAKFFGERFSFSPPGEDKFFTDVVEGYRPIVDDATESVVRVMVGPKQVALGTVIRADGYVLTKASEVKDVTPTIELYDGQRFAASVEQEFAEYDLALLRVPKKLNAADLSAVSDGLPLGTFVSAVGVGPTPLAIGVLSVAERSLAAKDRPFLGVSLRAAEDGLAINSVVENSAASEAGLQEGDIVRTLDGKKFTAVPLFIQSLGRRRPGDEIKLKIVRNGEEFEQSVKLGSRSELPPDRTRGRYPTGGKLSDQRGGYPNALQTDLPFQFNECGSPLVDLDGRIIGVNIARAGRTKSYAIPAGTISKLVEEALPE
jgi:serine protease Do